MDKNKENKYKIIVLDEDDLGTRLDKYISENILFEQDNDEKISRNYVQKLIKDANVLVNQKIKKPSYKINLNDEITIILPEAIKYNLEQWNFKLDIIYEDEHVLVINKPAGIVVHPSCGHMDNKTLVNSLLYHCKDLSGINGVLRPGIVHRLDKDTSGLMIIAKNDISHKNLSAQLQNRSLSRKYIAICEGNFNKDDFEFTSQIGRSSKDRKKMAVLKTGGKEAVTHFKILKHFFLKKQNLVYTLVEVSLKTGRTHQIRVHLSHLGYPIIGDPIYNKKQVNPLDIHRQALHAYKIKFIHPFLNKEMDFECDLPEDIKNIISFFEKRGQI